jgi:NAD(P)-dependent dehydrogenase (short-subunit alcohol dehydrogenase family)
VAVTTSSGSVRPAARHGTLYSRGRRCDAAGVDLSGRVAVVTGASRGLGFLLAREFAAQGCRVAICARDAEELRSAGAALEREGAEVLTVQCDVTDRAETDALVATVLDRFGSVDVLVTNAGVIQAGPLPTMRLEDFEDALAVMFWGVVLPTLAALPHLRRTRGRIVTITSIGGKIAAPHLLPYDCAKFAAVGFSEGLGAELAREGIRVTTVVPGLMRTGSPRNAFFKGRTEREYTWFTLADSVPGLSIDAERAARRIVSAARRGRAEVVLTVPAMVAVRVHGIFPGTTTRVLGLVNRMLPRGGSADQDAEQGAAVEARLGSRIFRGLTRLTRSAARRFGQLPGPRTVPPPVRSARRAADARGRAGPRPPPPPR